MVFTHVRPYSSDNGAETSGPNDRERNPIETVIPKIVGFFISCVKFSFRSHRVRARDSTIFFCNFWQNGGHHSTSHCYEERIERNLRVKL
jgi:hypothetical protein